MQMTEEGLALIRACEGFRARAYRDAVGVWTIGFGHTSAAGAPEVSPGLEVSKVQAGKILARDVETFARGVARAVTVTLSDNEFSALVCFAFNVGLGNFRASGVLKALNAGDREAVPRRLQLWVKAGGRTLPGLVKRRAAEAALFLKTGGETVPAPIEKPVARPAHRSKTVWAAFSLALLAGLDQVARALGYGVLSLAVFAAICLSVAWIIRERRKKSTEDGV